MRKMQLHFPFSQSQKGGVLKSAPFLFAFIKSQRWNGTSMLARGAKLPNRVVDSWLAVLESDQM